MSKPAVRVGTRGSALARVQSGMMADSVANITGVPCELIIIKTEGDRMQDVPFGQIEGKGFFTKELEEALLDGRIDMAVHSLKDLPTENPPDLVIAAIPPREKAHDLLLIRADLANKAGCPLLPPGAVVGTSSKRRALQIKTMQEDLEIRELRGNVPTRINKLVNGMYDAVIIASAGFRRLGLVEEGYRSITLDYDKMLPAPGQGALALQVRKNDQDIIRLLENLHDPNTATAVETERKVLEMLGGGCGMPLGVYAQCRENEITGRALLGPDDWQIHDAPAYVRAEASGAFPGETARRLVETLKRSCESAGWPECGKNQG
jgi:hydroxymethylbilane synthase